MPKTLMVFHTLMQETSAAVQLPRFSTVYHYKTTKILWILEEGAAIKLIQAEWLKTFICLHLVLGNFKCSKEFQFAAQSSGFLSRA